MAFYLTFPASLLAALLLIHASRKHKRHPLNTSLINAGAIVERELAPEGTVLVRGELWPARSQDDSFIATNARVRVVGSSNHLLLIEELHC